VSSYVALFCKIYQKTKGFLKHESKNQRFFDTEKMCVWTKSRHTKYHLEKIPGGRLLYSLLSKTKNHILSLFSHDDVMLLLLLGVDAKVMCVHMLTKKYFSIATGVNFHA